MRILIVEDEAVIGMDLAAMVQGWGLTPDGPYMRSAQALDAIRNNTPDLAILDVNLGGGDTSMPIAEALSETGTPYIFLTGYISPEHAPTDLSTAMGHLRKPVAEHELRELVLGSCPSAAE